MSSALSGLVNQSSAYVAGGDRPDADGQQPPEPVPLRAAALRRRRPDHHRRQQRPVPQAGRGARRARARRRPALRPQRGPHRQPRAAAPAAGRAAAHPHARTSGSTRSSRPACRAGRSTPSTAGVAFAEEVGLDPVVQVGEGDAAVPSVRNPITFSETPRRLRAPATGARRARRRDPTMAQRRRPRMSRTSCSFPTSLGHLRRRPDPAARPGPRRRPDGQGRLRRAGLLAGRDAPAHAVGDAGLRGRARGPGRPRLHPHRHRRPADLPLRARLAAGCARGRPARRRVPLPRRHRGLRQLPARHPRARLEQHEGDLPDDDAGWDALALEAVRTTKAAGRFVPGLGHPVHKVDRPAHAGADRHRRGGGTARPAPAAVRGDRPGPRAGPRSPAPAQRCRRLRRRARRPRPARRAAARLRAAGPRRRAARPDRRGAAADRSAWTPT